MRSFVRSIIHHLQKILKWLAKGMMMILAVIVALFLLIYGWSYIVNWRSATVRDYLESNRLGLTYYVNSIPDFRVLRYSNYPNGCDIVDRHVIQFKEPINESVVALMDSLCQTEDHKSLSGWDYCSSKDEYTYWFFDIAHECQDSVRFYPGNNRAVIVFRQSSRGLAEWEYLKQAIANKKTEKSDY